MGEVGVHDLNVDKVTKCFCSRNKVTRKGRKKYTSAAIVHVYMLACIDFLKSPAAV